MVHRSESNSIDCSSFEERIHQLLDDRLTLTGDQRLMDHAAQCDTCNSLIQDFDSVEDSVRLLHSDIEAAINGRRAEQKAAVRQSSQLGWIVALAATLLLFVGMIRSENNHRDKIAVRPTISSVVAVTPLSEGIGKAISKAKPTITPVRVRKTTPPSSPFSPEFSLADHIPRVPTVPTLEQISTRFENFEPVINYSSEIPGIRPAQCSLSFTIDLIKKSFTRPASKTNPDLGQFAKSLYLVSA